jgi:hypothetical protein
MKTKTLSHQTIALITAMVIAMTFFAFAPLASANTGDTGILAFTNLRERQITNREKIKINLLQMLSSEEEKQAVLAPSNTPETPVEHFAQTTYSHTQLVSITYRLADITDRLESRMLLLKNQGVIIPLALVNNFASVRTQLETVTQQLLTSDNATLDHALVRSELVAIRLALQNIVAELKTIVTPQI